MDLAAAAERHATLENRLGLEIAGRTTLDERLAAAETARHEAARQQATELAALTTQLADVRAQYDAAVEQTASVERQLTEAAATLEHTRRDWSRTSPRQLRSGIGARPNWPHPWQRARLPAPRSKTVWQGRSRPSARAQAAELAAAAERHATLEQQVSHERASIRSVQDAFAQVEESSRLALEASSRDIARLQGETDGLRRQLGALRTQAAALRRDAERVPALRLQLEQSHKENRRQFERAPYGLCECSRDGAITRVNHSLARLLGYRGNAGLQDMDVVATVFECGDDLRWLLERTAGPAKCNPSKPP